jgi:hypothetical protein
LADWLIIGVTFYLVRVLCSIAIVSVRVSPESLTYSDPRPHSDRHQF